MPDYVIRIIAEGEDNASAPLGRVQGALGNIAQFAAGNLIANGIMAIGSAIGSAAQQAVGAVSSYERMGQSLDALLAREIRNASGVEKTITVGQQRITLTQAEIAQIDKLKSALETETLQRDVLGAKIQEQKQRVIDLTAQYGENGLATIKERAELALMEQQYAKSGTSIDQYGQKISALEGKQGALVNVTKQVVEGQLSMADALAQAGPKAAALMQWTEKLAIQSPFDSNDIATTLQQAMNFKFSSEQAQRLTQDLVDLTAATGGTGDKMKLISYAVGQMNLSDKVLMQDLRQLMNAGVDVESVLNKMGYSLKDVGEKSIDSKQFIEEFQKSIEMDFAGAALRQANSLPGLLTSLGEISNIALRDVFTGAITQIKPVLGAIVDLVTNPQFRAALQSFGQWIGQGINTAVGLLQQGIGIVQTFKKEFDFQRMMGKNPLEALASTFRVMLPTEFSTAITNVFNVLNNLVGVATRFWSIFQSGLTAGLSPISALMMTLKNMLPANLYQAVFQLFDAFRQGGTWLTASLMPALLQFGVFLQTSVMPALLQFGVFLQTNVLPYVIQFGTWLGGTILTGAQQLGSWIVSSLVPALVLMANTVGPVVLPVLQQLGTWLQTTAIPAIQQFAQFMGPILQQAFSFLGGYITETLIPTFTAMQVFLIQKGLPALGDLAKVVGTTVNGALSALGGIWSGIVDNFNRAVKFIADTTKNLTELATAITATIGSAFQWLNDTILQPLAQTFDWLVGLSKSFLEWLQKIADMLANLQIPDFLQRHSPSPLEQALMNSNEHLREMANLAPSAMRAYGGLRDFAALPAPAMGFAASPSLPRGMSADTRTVNIHGNVSIGSESAAREFWRLMGEWENGVIAEARTGAV